MKIRIFLQKTFLPNVAQKDNMSTMWSMFTMCPVVAFARSVAACLTPAAAFKAFLKTVKAFADFFSSAEAFVSYLISSAACLTSAASYLTSAAASLTSAATFKAALTSVAVFTAFLKAVAAFLRLLWPSRPFHVCSRVRLTILNISSPKMV
jgi:hypothetical protein